MAESQPGEWVVQVHPRERIIEVVYPARPVPGAIDRYEDAARAAVKQLAGRFSVLADQRAMPVLTAELSERISALLLWSKGQGLARAVRLVRRSAIAELQARRILRDGGVEEEERVLFYSREDAWRALTGSSGEVPPEPARFGA